MYEFKSLYVGNNFHKEYILELLFPYRLRAFGEWPSGKILRWHFG